METLRGGEDFKQLADRLNEAADAKLRRQVYKGLREIARPVGEAMTHALGGALPQRNGLGPRVAKSKIRQTNATTGKNPRVVVWLKSAEGYDLAGMEAGTVRHPTYGHKPWVGQSVPSGRATEAATAMAPLVRKNLERHINTTLDEIGK